MFATSTPPRHRSQATADEQERCRLWNWRGTDCEIVDHEMTSLGYKPVLSEMDPTDACWRNQAKELELTVTCWRQVKVLCGPICKLDKGAKQCMTRQREILEINPGSLDTRCRSNTRISKV
jgi:hypothetical protein